jgi:hypothetical protein
LNSQAPYAKQTAKRRAEAAIATSSSNAAGNTKKKKPKTKSSFVKDPTSKGKSVSELQKTIVLDETSRIQHVPTSNTYEEMEEDGDDFKMSVEEKKLLEKLLAKSRLHDGKVNHRLSGNRHHDAISSSVQPNYPPPVMPAYGRIHRPVLPPPLPNHSTGFLFDPYTGQPLPRGLPPHAHYPVIAPTRPRNYPPHVGPYHSIPYAEAPEYYVHQEERQSFGRSFTFPPYMPQSPHDPYYPHADTTFLDQHSYDYTYHDREGHPRGRL